MPNFPMKIDDELKEAIKKTKKGGGVTKETLDTHRRHMGHLDMFCQENYNRNIQDVCEKEDKEALIDILQSFFHAYRVKSRDEDGQEVMLRPTRNTADAAKSHLKKGIKLLSNGKLDIGDFDDFEVKE